VIILRKFKSKRRLSGFSRFSGRVGRKNKRTKCSHPYATAIAMTDKGFKSRCNVCGKIFYE
jgi:hypothetical protein